MGKIKTCILGYKRSGKDALTDQLRDEYHHKYITTSLLIAEIVIYPALKDSCSYASVQECYEDRHNHRVLWKILTDKYCEKDKARLVKEVLTVNDFYVGLRCKEQLAECKRQGVFDFHVWVDKDGCFESEDSCTVDRSMADYFVDNNGTLQDLKNIGAGFVNHLITSSEDKCGFRSNHSIDYGHFLDEQSWNETETTKPDEEGNYLCLCNDIINCWVEELHWDGKYWMQNKKDNGKGFLAIVDKWKSVEVV